jgi:hypothetical protein
MSELIGVSVGIECQVDSVMIVQRFGFT